MAESSQMTAAKQATAQLETVDGNWLESSPKHLPTVQAAWGHLPIPCKSVSCVYFLLLSLMKKELFWFYLNIVLHFRAFTVVLETLSKRVADQL